MTLYYVVNYCLLHCLLSLYICMLYYGEQLHLACYEKKGWITPFIRVYVDSVNLLFYLSISCVFITTTIIIIIIIVIVIIVI